MNITNKYLTKKDIQNIFLLMISIILFIGILQWGYYLIKNKKYKNRLTESFVIPPPSNPTVDLPMNSRYTCENVCGPMARCSITGEQCSADIDCYGCQPKEPPIIQSSSIDVPRENDAGKMSSNITPSYSTLTTDLGTKAKLYQKGENIKPPSYFKGVNEWRNSYDAGMKLYDTRYNPSLSVNSTTVSYPERPSMSGEFTYKGPLAANDFL
jgi:hypothetical protein